MKLKKIGIATVLVVLTFSIGGCSEKEQQQPEQQQSQTTMKQEESTKEEEKRITNQEEILEKLPELQEAKNYLFEHYPTLSKKAQEKEEGKERKPIVFHYTTIGEKPSQLSVWLSFDKSATKKEMVEAMQYISKAMNNLFSDNTKISFQIWGMVLFSGDTYMENYLDERGVVTLKYTKGEETKDKWEEEIAPLKMQAFNPEEVKEGEVVAYFEGEPPTQTANNDPQPTQSTSGLTMSTVMETLSQFGIEETTNKEATDGYFSIGSDPTGLTSYMAGVYTDGTIQSVTYIATKVEGMTDEKFATSAGLYLMMCARIPYGDTEKGGEATTFVMDNMEAALQGEQITTIDDWKLTLSYIAETNIFSLEFSK